MRKVRVVIDTNVFLVSLAPSFRLHWIFQHLVAGTYEICVTTDILNEYQEIISSRYGVDKTNATLDFLLLLPNVLLVTPYYNWNLLKDQDDNKFVDCAIAGNADYIITNDNDFKRLDNLDFPPIVRMTAQTFEDRFKKVFEEEE